MSPKIDWCEYFAAIEKDPTAITPNITVRQFYEAKRHIEHCEGCFQRTERVLAKARPTKQINWEKN